MRPSPLLIDVAIAVLCALVVLIVSPGVAVDAIIALLVLAGCAVSLALSRRGRRGRRRMARGRAGGVFTRRRGPQ